MTTQKEALKLEFVRVSSYLLNQHNSKGTTFFRFLSRYKKRWKLQIDLFDVITDAIERGILFIEKTGERIETPEAWLRVVCLNILRDQVKANVRMDKALADVKIILESTKRPSPNHELQEKLSVLQEAIGKLSEKDHELIVLRFFERKSYKQIQYMMKLRGEIIRLPALRKRESRALGKLREIFVSTYHGSNDIHS